MNSSYQTNKMVKKMIQESIELKEKVKDLAPEIEKAANLIVQTYKNNKKVLIAGNGGSAADSQHVAGELVGRFKQERKALPCIALTTDSSILTAWSNDYSFDTIFSRQIEALGQENDIFVAISTSGNSKNLIEAIKEAKKQGLKTITLLGKDGGLMKDQGDINLIVPSNNTPRVQESHIMILHIICELVEKGVFQ